VQPVRDNSGDQPLGEPLIGVGDQPRLRTILTGRSSARRLGSRLAHDPDGYFGARVAAGYDDPSDRVFRPEAVGLLAGLAGSGRALEPAIGIGRIGLPLWLRVGGFGRVKGSDG
jgi:hypothetical protein